MNTTKFWITSIASVATAGALGLAIAQQTDQKMDQGGSTAGGAAKQEPAAPAPAASSSTTSTTVSSESSSTSTPAAEKPVAKADRG